MQTRFLIANWFGNALIKTSVSYLKIILQYKIMERRQEMPPKIRTEYARKYFYYTGAKVYNELPLKIRKITNATVYEKSLKDYFS